MNPTTFLVFSFLVMLTLGNIMGWLVNDIYRYYSDKRVLNGIYLGYAANHSAALEEARGYDEWGNWVCVNVRGMSVKEIQETAIHESMHELFATYCTKHNDNCIKEIEKMEAENNGNKSL